MGRDLVLIFSMKEYRKISGLFIIKLHIVKAVTEGKNVVFYIAGDGEKRQSFIGCAKIKSIIDNKNTTVDTNQEFKQVLFHVEFKELKIFDKDIKIKELSII